MVDVGGIIGYTTTTGIEALKILNKWLDSKETAEAWYGKAAGDFVKKRRVGKKLFRKKYASPEIEHVFTIQKEDWQIVMEEALPVAHTWYRKRKDEPGECSWLPLYRACRDQLGSSRVLQKAGVALASTGLVSGLPAARLDLWGLIVMAFSNGARARVTTAEGGGFNATLLCRHFILTISQPNVNAPTIGHLEPREHPAESQESLTVDESRYLLIYGQTFSPTGVTTAWVLNGQNSDPPPTDLIDSRSDPLFARTVLDTFQASALKDKFHFGIIQYWEEWARFMSPRQPNGVQDNITTQHEPFRPSATVASVSSGHVTLDSSVDQEMQTLHELKTDIGMISYESDQSDDDHQPSGYGAFSGKMLNRIGLIHGLVVKMLWRLKLLFLYEAIEVVDNLNRYEVLYLFKAYGELIESLTKPHLLHRAMDFTRHGLDTKLLLSQLLDYHSAILVRARMLNYCQQIHVALSVRNTGHNVLLS